MKESNRQRLSEYFSVLRNELKEVEDFVAHCEINGYGLSVHRTEPPGNTYWMEGRFRSLDKHPVFQHPLGEINRSSPEDVWLMNSIFPVWESLQNAYVDAINLTIEADAGIYPDTHKECLLQIQSALKAAVLLIEDLLYQKPNKPDEKDGK